MSQSGSIAVVGMSGAFPGARNIGELWRNLCEGREAIRFLDTNDSSRDTSHGKTFVPAVSCMEDIELFDASFFGMTPAEAEITDPQHRLLLEHAWTALEHAGYDPGAYRGAIGVFAGSTTNTYLLRNLASHPDLMRNLDPVQLNVGNGSDFLTTRISYKLDLRGPSHTVQSACSTSLVAVHCASRSLLDFECDMALAGGVSVNLTLLRGYWFHEGGVVSGDGHCRPFDADAGGTIFGGGVGMVVLKRLEDALADNDVIHAIIRGSAVNNDGLRKAGYTAPAVDGQAAVITEALASAGVEPGTITYVECHGTGTRLGDPIEIRALAKALGLDRDEPCVIGSVKSNLGHLDAAAGVTGLIKAILSLKEKAIPPTLHFRRSNPLIESGQNPFLVNTELKAWESKHRPLRAGVSAFGVGGTNAHLVLEEAPARPGMPPSGEPALLVLSARTSTALDEMRANLADHLSRNPGQSLADVGFTLQTGRRHFTHRIALVCHSHDEGADILDQKKDRGREIPPDEEPSVAFFFPDTTEGCHRTLAHLYAENTAFRASFDRCARAAQRATGVELTASANDSSGAETFLERRALLLAYEYSLAQLWVAYGVKPFCLVASGLGHLTAACVSGIVDIEDAFSLVDMGSPESPRAWSGRLQRPEIPVVSPGGEWLTGVNAGDPDYWTGSSLSETNYEQALERIWETPGAILLEIGPSQMLQPFAMRHPRVTNARGIVASFEPGEMRCTAGGVPLHAVGALWELGVKIDWAAIHAGKNRSRCALPTYAFDRRRHWIEMLEAPPGTTPAAKTEVRAAPQQLELSGAVRPPLRNPYVPPDTELERLIVSVLEDVLRIHPVGVTDKYGELGGDSLMAARAVAEINSRLGCDIRAVDLYDGLTVRELSERISRTSDLQHSGVGEPTSSSGDTTARRNQYRQERRSMRRSL